MRAVDDGRSMRPPLPLWVALIVAAGAGPVMDGAFPDRGWWPLAFLGIGLALLVARGRRFGSALLVGLVFGATFWFPHILWATTFLGVVPWAALAGLMSLWMALGSGLIALAYRWVPRVWPSRLGRLTLLPAVVAGLWVAREGVQSTWPYGGFSWGRVAFSQSQSPLGDLFAWVGTSGVSFLMVFLVALLLEAVREVRVDGMLRAVLVTGVATLLLVIPAVPVQYDGSIRVGAVQGNTKSGYFDPPERVGDNLLAQVEASRAVDGQGVELVVWPEGASDLDPLTDPAAAALFDQVSTDAGAPLLGWSVTQRDGKYFNTSLLWRPGDGVLDYYDKKHPVPFGEYVPDRAFWRPFAPELIDLIGREYTPGTRDGVIDVGEAIAGISICFDIVDDAVVRGAVQQGATVLIAQSNNADFGDTDENTQQLAITRIRALETGRSVVNVSTVGTSEILLADGTTIDSLPRFQAGAMVTDVPTADGITPATRIGAQLELLAGGVGLLGLLVAATMRPRTKKRADRSRRAS